MTLLPFDLSKALAGEPVFTNYGKQCFQLTLFSNLESDDKLIGVVDKNLMSFTLSGKNFLQNCYLGMKSIPKKYWINIFKDGDRVICGDVLEEMPTIFAYNPKKSFIKTISFEVGK